MRLLMIDNFDSFTYNLVQYLRELGAVVDIVRNDCDRPLPELLAEYERVVRAELLRLGLGKQLQLDMNGDFKQMAPVLHRFLHDIEDAPVPAGLPIFGESPTEARLEAAIGAYLFAAYPQTMHDDVEESTCAADRAGAAAGGRPPGDSALQRGRSENAADRVRAEHRARWRRLQCADVRQHRPAAAHHARAAAERRRRASGEGGIGLHAHRVANASQLRAVADEEMAGGVEPEIGAVVGVAWLCRRIYCRCRPAPSTAQADARHHHVALDGTRSG